MRGVFRLGPKFLAFFSSLNARRFSVGIEIPSGFSQFGCEACFGQGRNSWQYLPICARRVFQSEPKFLPGYPSFNKRRYSARTEIPGGNFQFECEVGTKKFLAIFTHLNARRFSVRTEIPGGFPQLECEAFFSQNQNRRRYFPV